MTSTATTAAAYPSAHVVDVALRDGSTLHVRPVSEDDTPKIKHFLGTLSQESVGFRFFGSPNLDWVCGWSVDVDYSDRYALVASTGPEHAIVAHGAYMRLDEHRAEVAFMVSDEWQGRGIATIMLAHLAAAAEEQGISTFFAEVLPHNHRMIDVFGESGFPVKRHRTQDVIEIELPTSMSAQTLDHFDQRDRTAAVAALHCVLEPRSVAVIGASRHRRTIGGELWHNLIAGGFTGEAYAVNDKAHSVQGRRAYSSISAVPKSVELAVIAVPADHVASVARECAAAGVRALVVVSGGFGEAGPVGEERQRELLGICRGSGMRIVGPNCLGVLNNAPATRLNATFAAGSPRLGKIGFLSQSGGLGVAMIEGAGRLGLGLSSFVSVGDKADISGNDLLQYWEHDENTDVVLLYLESFGNPRRFARIARRVSESKPIVAVKSGRSPAGQRAGASHTGALVASSDVTVDALFEQAGVIRTDTVHELFDVAALLSAQPVPRGDRVAIVTNAGGPGILCADACQAAGLDVMELDARVRKRLAGFLDPQAALSNPIDMIASASAESYRRTIETLVSEQACDAVLAIFVPPLVTDPHDVAREIHAAAATAEGVSIAAVFMTGEGMPPELAGGGTASGATSSTSGVPPTGVRVPGFDFPEDAARALSHAVRYARWRKRPAGTVVSPADCRPAAAAAIVARNLEGGGGSLSPEDVRALLECYGLPLVKTHTVASSEVELLMGVVHDESFGPVIACGAGGTRAELLGDVAVRITPLTDLDARAMLRSLRSYPLLEGHRGSAPCDVEALEDVLLRMSALVQAHPEVVDLDANPVVAGPHGALILDARVRVSEAPPRKPEPSLRG